MPLLIIFLLLWLGIQPLTCLSGQDRSNILVLQSYHHGQGWTDRQLEGARAALDAAGQPYTLYVEHLDSKRWVVDGHLEAFHRRHRATLFGNVPVVFSGVNFFRDELLDDFDQVTGVAETFDAAATIALMQQLHPDTRRIIVVIDATSSGRAIMGELQPVLTAASGRLRFDVWQDRTIAALQRDLADLGASDLVLLMPFARDADGRHVEFDELARIVSTSSPVPVYGTWDFLIGNGIVGGRLTTAIDQGRAAGEMLVRILRGEDPDDIAVTRVAPTRFQFDARQLQRHGIATNRLPDDSEVLYRGWWDRNLAEIAAFAMLTMLALGLLYAWHRKHAEKRATEQRLAQSERRFRSLFDQSPDPTWIIDGERFTECNRAAVAKLGYADTAQLLQTHPADLSPELQPDGEPSAKKASRMMALARGKGIHRFEWVHKTRTGNEFWAEVTLSLVDPEHANLLYCVWRDITLRKEAEQLMRQHAAILEKEVADRTRALEAAMQEAERANDAKSRFLAKVSHELRTPMHAILSYTRLGLKHADDARITRYLQNIADSGERLTTLLNDLLDLSSLEAGALGAAIAPNDIRAVAANAITELDALAREKDIRLDLDPGEPLIVPCDTALMTRVLVNVLSNAITFSPASSSVTVRMHAADDDVRLHPGQVKIVVTDSGPGIPQDRLESVFEKFVQCDTSRGTQVGTGLGLAISREILDLHNGEIWAESPPAGQVSGTAIHIRLPVAAVDSSHDTARARAAVAHG